MAELTLPLPATGRPWWQGLTTGRFLSCSALLLILGLTILYPIYLLVINGFVIELDDGTTRVGIDHWVQAWSQPGLMDSVVNTFNRVLVSELIAMPAAIALAWFAARTDIPGKTFISVSMWVAFFLPTLPVILGWILVLDPDFGLLNQLIKGAFDREKGFFDIYSFWGIQFAHLMTKAIAVKYIFLLPAFRNISAALEETSRVCGGSAWYTLRHIVIPVLKPAILITLIVSLIHSLESFEIELILGAPIDFQVFSTKIYQLINEEPAQFGMATVLGLGILGTMLPLIIWQRYVSTGRNYATVTSGFKTDLLRLRAWRWPAFAVIALFALNVTIVPFIFLCLGTFMKIFGYFTMPDGAYTLEHWQIVFADPIFFNSVFNTLYLGFGAALLGTVFAALVAYVSVRTKYRLRGALDFLSWLPASIPGIILGLGLLMMFLRVPIFNPLYGTIGVLIMAVFFASLTTGVQLIKSNMIQLGFDLEEASTVAGGSWFYTFRNVVFPILGHVLLSVGILIFASATRNVANIAMLVTNRNRPLSMLQVDYMVEGIFEPAAIVGVITVAITCGMAMLAVAFGKRIGFRL